MNSWAFWLLPSAILVFLVSFAARLWRSQSKRSRYEDGTKEHSERIYRDFEFFVKIFIALVGAVGYLKLKTDGVPQETVRSAMKGVGALGLVSMCTLALFVICHQGSKIRRWKSVEWNTMLYWQEVWMIISMFVMASGLWAVAWLW